MPARAVRKLCGVYGVVRAPGRVSFGCRPNRDLAFAPRWSDQSQLGRYSELGHNSRAHISWGRLRGGARLFGPRGGAAHTGTHFQLNGDLKDHPIETILALGDARSRMKSIALGTEYR